MSSCCLQNRDTGRFFSFFARHYRRRFEKRGFEQSQTQLVEGITRAGFQDANLLEIGCGVGYLHQQLLKQGAHAATGIDLSEKMLAQAQAGADREGLTERTRYLAGDLVERAQEIAPADIVILDKVICCYPDARALVQRSAAKAERVYAFTIPRDRWPIRALMKLGGYMLALLRCRFRSFVHDPALIDAWLTEAGFVRSYDNETLMWLTRVYRRLGSTR